ncbi:MAG: hypothetical protein ACM3ML_30060 [Micromonosporaceae bacterium]
MRWTGPDDHYLFVLDGLAATRRLIRKAGGVATELWQAPGPFVSDEWREVVLEAIGTRLRVLLDGTVLADLRDATLASGAVALYAGATATCRFAALTVDAAEPSWMTYHEFANDEPMAAGRRVRLFVGTAADLTLEPQGSEVRRFRASPPPTRGPGGCPPRAWTSAWSPRPVTSYTLTVSYLTPLMPRRRRSDCCAPLTAPVLPSRARPTQRPALGLCPATTS